MDKKIIYRASREAIKIDNMEIIRETRTQYVTISQDGEEKFFYKNSIYAKYFETHEEAVQFYIGKYSSEIKQAQKNLNKALALKK